MTRHPFARDPVGRDIDDRLAPFTGDVALIGPFDPATLAHMLPGEVAAPIASMRSSPGVPIQSLAAALISHGTRTTLIGGVRGVRPVDISNGLLRLIVYPKGGGWPFVMNGRRRDRQEILSRLRALQPSVAHAHWTFEAGRGVADWGGPKVLTVHDAAWEYARRGLTPGAISVAYTARWLANTDATLKRFRHVVAVSPFIEQYLRRRGFHGEIRMIPNAIPELPAGIAARTVFPKTGRITFGVYGGPGKLKNVERAILAFGRIADRLPGSRLLVFGTWDHRKRKYESARIRFNGALPHIEFLRHLAEDVDIWVHPSVIEAHPLSICEAIQAGCAVIAGQDSGGVAWTLDDGRAGYLTDVMDVVSIARSMLEAATNWEAASAKTLNGQKRVQEVFSSNAVLMQHLSYYRDIEMAG